MLDELGAHDDVLTPRLSTKTDWEVEPAVVIASNENVAGIEKIKRLPRMNNRVVVIDQPLLPGR